MPGTALRDFTWMPTETYRMKGKTADEIFNKIKHADEMEWVMGGVCDKPYHDLVTGHAYSVLGAYTLSTGQKLIKVRNPHSREYYTGPWRDDDPRWTPALKEEVGLVEKNDGIFWLPLEGFKTAFWGFDILQYGDYAMEVKQVSKTGKVMKFKMTSDIDQKIKVTFDYQKKRQTPKGCPMPDLWFNAYVNNGPPISISKQEAYGLFEVDMKAGKEVDLKIYNWADATATSNYVLTTYSTEGSPVVINDA